MDRSLQSGTTLEFAIRPGSIHWTLHVTPRPVRVRVRYVLVCARLAWVVAQVESEFAQVSQGTSSVAWIESVQVAQGRRPGRIAQVA